MKQKTMPTTEGHFKSYGGEARTRLIGGIFVGAFVGLLAGIVLVMMWGAGDFSIPGADGVASVPAQYFLTIMATVIVGAFAGATVGIGVPRIKTRPEQGLVKKWKPLLIEDENQRAETIYVPEETRKNRINNRENLEL